MSIDLDFILEHAFRYRILIPEVLLELPELEGSTAHNLDTVLTRTSKKGLLQSGSLYAIRTYYQLTEKGIHTFAPDIPQSNAVKLSKPLSQTTKAWAYATTVYCCFNEPPLEKLTLREFQEYFPRHYRPGLHLNYYVNNTEQRLGLLHVDTGGRGRWDRLIGNLQDRIERHRKISGFLDYINQRRFELVLIVARKEKAESLTPAIKKLSTSQTVPIHVRVIPELLHILAPEPLDPPANKKPEED